MRAIKAKIKRGGGGKYFPVDSNETLVESISLTPRRFLGM